ncbi:MAG: alanine--glyoxylate aminotransferase family protein [Holophagales bacterium]|nr:alanine--glyoxylate aminotransferase family protein [Holophagales bacterium]
MTSPGGSDAHAPELRPAERVLLGPGPSTVPARVLEAMAKPTLGHLDPQYLRIMDGTGLLLRRVFRTENRLTLAVSGTGSAGMEACVANLVEPGDEVLICVAGVFGGRMREVCERYGAAVHAIEVPWGETVDPEQVRSALEAHPEVVLVGLVHAETSTGAHQPLEEISRLTHEAGALLLVDCVTSLAGMEVRVDEWGIDAAYSGTQKCLSCPPGLAPVTFSPRAEEKIHDRGSKVRSWYLDMTLIGQYWGQERSYHHTAPINMSYALYEALRLVIEEGLDARIERHHQHHLALRAGLEALGLRYVPERTLTTLNAVHVPEGVDDARVRRRLLDRYGIEIGAGLGPFAGKAWRIGLMGHSSSRRNVTLVLSALASLLAEEGVTVSAAEALTAADGAYAG